MSLKLDTPPSAELDAVLRLRVALRRFQAATDVVTRRHALTPRQYDLLAMLHGRDPEGRTPGRLAVDLRLGRNTLTELITRAADAGLVARTPHATDARSKRIVPTEEGSRRYLEAVAELRPERARLLELLQEAASHAQELAPRRPLTSGRDPE